MCGDHALLDLIDGQRQAVGAESGAVDLDDAFVLTSVGVVLLYDVGPEGRDTGDGRLVDRTDAIRIGGGELHRFVREGGAALAGTPVRRHARPAGLPGADGLR